MDLKSIAQKAAWIHCGDHKYTPKTLEEARSFEPHAWVLEAMAMALEQQPRVANVPDFRPTPTLRDMGLSNNGLTVALHDTFQRIGKNKVTDAMTIEHYKALLAEQVKRATA